MVAAGEGAVRDRRARRLTARVGAGREPGVRDRPASERTLDAGAYLLGALELALIVGALALAALARAGGAAAGLDRARRRGSSRRCSASPR